jgi:hypothetical protein
VHKVLLVHRVFKVPEDCRDYRVPVHKVFLVPKDHKDPVDYKDYKA